MPTATATDTPLPPSTLVEQFAAKRRKLLDPASLPNPAKSPTQQREQGLDLDTVNRYADAYRAGEPVPAIKLFIERLNGEDVYHYGDGHHRVAAARKAKLEEIDCIVEKGTAREALLYAVGANAEHGLRRTPADMRHAVSTMLADEEWRDWSNREIARRTRTSEAFVRNVRKELKAEVQQITRKDGTKQKARNADAKKPKQQSLLDPCAEERAVVDATWSRMRELPGAAKLPETKCRILTALYHFNQVKNPGDAPSDVPTKRKTLEIHIGCPIDVHAGQLAAAGKIHRAENDSFVIDPETYQAIDKILRPRPTFDPNGPMDDPDDWHHITRRAIRAINVSGTSVLEYSEKHSLPLSYLADLISTGEPPTAAVVAAQLHDAFPPPTTTTLTPADDHPVSPDLPPGIYLDADEAGGEYHVLISSDDQAKELLVCGKKIHSSYDTSDLITDVLSYRVSGCQVYSVRLKDGGNINELVTWNGEIRKLFACNEDRFVIGTGPKPKNGKDDSAYLATLGKPLHPATASDEIPDTDGPEDITAPPADPPAAKPSSAPAQPSAPAAPADKTDPHRQNLRPLGLRRVDQQRIILAHRLRTGKPQWRGHDADLFLLGLIAGVPTQPVAWCDLMRGQARDRFEDALRAEVAERISSGEGLNSHKWPQLVELCALWGIDHQAIEIEAEHAVPA